MKTSYSRTYMRDVRIKTDDIDLRSYHDNFRDIFI